MLGSIAVWLFLLNCFYMRQPFVGEQGLCIALAVVVFCTTFFVYTSDFVGVPFCSLLIFFLFVVVGLLWGGSQAQQLQVVACSPMMVANYSLLGSMNNDLLV